MNTFFLLLYFFGDITWTSFYKNICLISWKDIIKIVMIYNVKTIDTTTSNENRRNLINTIYVDSLQSFLK